MILTDCRATPKQQDLALSVVLQVTPSGTTSNRTSPLLNHEILIFEVILPDLNYILSSSQLLMYNGIFGILLRLRLHEFRRGEEREMLDRFWK